MGRRAKWTNEVEGFCPNLVNFACYHLNGFFIYEQGWMYYHNGDRLYANFWKGRADGEGRFYSAQGDVFFGQFRENWRHGEFLYIEASGVRCVPLWIIKNLSRPDYSFKAAKRHGLNRNFPWGGRFGQHLCYGLTAKCVWFCLWAGGVSYGKMVFCSQGPLQRILERQATSFVASVIIARARVPLIQHGLSRQVHSFSTCPSHVAFP